MPDDDAAIIEPTWRAPARVRALTTTRVGGVSTGRWQGLNLALHVGDESASVLHNRAILRARHALPAEPAWLAQTHGTTMIEAGEPAVPPEADASFATVPGRICAIMTADCLPILACDRAGSIVVAMHAGWRGLLDGIITRSLGRFAIPACDWLAWIGPGIGVESYVVGAELRDRFVAADPATAPCFPRRAGRVHADLRGIARHQLRAFGVGAIDAYTGCTAGEPTRFYSYRRDGVTGRFATLIWLT